MKRRDVEKQVKDWNLSYMDIRNLVMHVGDHAGAQGHVWDQCGCKACIKLMRRLFPEGHWPDESWPPKP